MQHLVSSRYLSNENHFCGPDVPGHQDFRTPGLLTFGVSSSASADVSKLLIWSLVIVEDVC